MIGSKKAHSALRNVDQTVLPENAASRYTP
jgi:hypothetical protein